MEDLFFSGDIILAEKVTYKKSSPLPGDLVVFKYPLNHSERFVMRCIATSGQLVEITDKVLYIDGETFNEPQSVVFYDPKIHDAFFSNRDNFGPYVVPENSIFVLGDNRDYAIDSRFWGEVPLEFVEARPLVVYFSWEKDDNAPVITSPISFLHSVFYNIGHFTTRLRINRIGYFPN